MPDDSDYDVSVLLNQESMENYGLTVSQVVNAIRVYNQNLPLGNHELGDLSYDYRIDNEISSIDELNSIPIAVNNGQSYITLAEITNIERDYKNTSVAWGGVYDSANNYAASITVFKKKNTNIFSAASDPKELINNTLEKPLYDGLHYEYTTDLSDVIVDDYKSLG